MTITLDDCDLTMGWNENLCAGTIGGIKKVIPVPKSLLNYTSLVITANEITTFNLVTPGVGGGYEWELEPGLSSATYPTERTDRGGVMTNQTLAMVLNNDTKDLRAELIRLAKNTCVFFVQKNNETWICLGLRDGLRATTGNEGTTGAAKTDPNGHTMSFIGREVEQVYDVDEAVIAAITIDESSS